MTGGEGGSGTASKEIASSQAGPSSYQVVVDGKAETQIISQVHAGDESTYIRFTYTPVETIENGALKFIVPDGWSSPQLDNANGEGYTYVDDRGNATTRSPDPGPGRSIIVPISSISADGSTSIVIHYGADDGAAKVPTEMGPSAFSLEVTASGAGTSGFKRLADLKDLTVDVRSQASGLGSASVAPNTVNAGDMTTVTITYDPIGEIDGGRVILTVPSEWAGGD